MKDYIDRGLISFFYPVSGYYILLPKIICFVSFKLSFLYYPETASLLAHAFMMFVIFAIAYAPTFLKIVNRQYHRSSGGG
ncbi:MAG: hypothetical protein LBR23_06305 [Spirochaetaceae bacterium]|nr:hypothetical protein [Spirochaetaceae bacterium]